VLAALLANGARAREIFKAIDEEQIGNPFYFQSRDILGVAPSGPLGMIGQFARAIVGTMARAIRANQWPSFAIMLADFQEHPPPGFYSTEPLETTLCDRFTALGYRHQFNHLSRELLITGTDIDTGEHLIFGAVSSARFAHLPDGRRIMRDPSLLPSDSYRRERRSRWRCL
jgi:hypothetical protein